MAANWPWMSSFQRAVCDTGRITWWHAAHWLAVGSAATVEWHVVQSMPFFSLERKCSTCEKRAPEAAARNSGCSGAWQPPHSLVTMDALNRGRMPGLE